MAGRRGAGLPVGGDRVGPLRRGDWHRATRPEVSGRRDPQGGAATQSREAAGTESPGTTVGSESTGMTAGTGSDIGSSGWTAGIGSPGIRSFGSTAGTASSGKGSGLRVNWYDRGHWGQTLDRLTRQRASGHQASSHLARQRAPRHLARQWAPSQLA
ncbi:unnamed protein product [Staurois parvus]|uniref:Uncharacterized protein n=1 Tax=Staurois parvus TaxID=386267 RepID=A0ABN9CRS4_9NEOB|nr:unnamed protein product [Staurois parvus]